MEIYTEESQNKSQLVRKYMAFWPYFLVSIIISILLALTYLRYTSNEYTTTAKIEIIDKAQDSEMALPTAMTIFNRSMINLENEIGVLNSNSLHSKVVARINSNISYSVQGIIKETQNHKDEWFSDYEIKYLFDPKEITKETRSHFIIIFDDNDMIIEKYSNEGEILKSYKFDNSLSTYNKKHDLPFNIKINEIENFSTRKLTISAFNDVVTKFQNEVIVTKNGKESDQLTISISHENKRIAEEYINTLIDEFDKDGISDRQLEYKRTIEFVDSRSKFLKADLEKIEENKKQFKKNNNLTEIESDAKASISQRLNYDNELFESKSQFDLAELLKKTLLENPNKLMPLNIGIENTSINNLIQEYNLLIKEKDRFLISAGPKNSLILNIESKIKITSENIINSINSFKESLQLSINMFEDKELEFANFYSQIPESEKILRSIERELEIKESLFLLLLQKKEEASINFAVVKPSLKIVDGAISSEFITSPNYLYVAIFTLFFALFIPFSVLYITFRLDNKVHTLSQLKEMIDDGISIVGETPHYKQAENIVSFSSREPFAESLRIIASNLEYLISNISNEKINTTILITSSIKGEGKTLFSVNLSSILSQNKKVILVGSDLRNPQLHKYFNIDKSVKGLTDYLVRKDVKTDDIIYKDFQYDFILSGTIPPNPTQLLSTDRFKHLIKNLKSNYDYILIDSAPTMLVADTSQISAFCDYTIYCVRANHTPKEIISDINLNYLNQNSRLKNINLVLNDVGQANFYGYAYSYKYGYKYDYNYGYGYGYKEDVD